MSKEKKISLINMFKEVILPGVPGELREILLGADEFSGEDDQWWQWATQDPKKYYISIDQKQATLAGTGEQVAVWRVNLFNSQVIPQLSLEKLGRLPQIKALASRYGEGISPEELVFCALGESNSQKSELYLAPDVGGETVIAGMNGFIVAEERFTSVSGVVTATFAYLNTIVSDPRVRGLFISSLINNLQPSDINIFGASTNDFKLIGIWRNLASESWKRGTGEPWRFYPGINPDGNIEILGKGAQKMVERFRRKPGLNVISGTDPDWSRGMIRFGQIDGIRRQVAVQVADTDLLSRLRESYGFNPDNADQLLCIAISPELSEVVTTG